MTPDGRNHVLDRSEIRVTDTPRVGPKVARLGHLAASGWRVPDGYAVTIDALPTALQSELARLFTCPDATAPSYLARQARMLIESQPIPSWLQDAVCAAHERLQMRTGQGSALRVAVRSSAIGEDSARASFAGQFSTYLGIKDVADVMLCIQACWASAYSAHALEYRRHVGIGPLHTYDLAVGVMELVDARSSGVVFTLDPVSGDRSRIVVEANWGFGESILSGQVTPDHWDVDRASGRFINTMTGGKLAWTVFDLAAQKMVLMPLPSDLAGQPCLCDEEVAFLCRKSIEIEAAEGCPQDVEWAIARDIPFPDSAFILQHRPETTTQHPHANTFDPVQYALRNAFKVRYT
jgi:pyruvate, water dikinase